MSVLKYLSLLAVPFVWANVFMYLCVRVCVCVRVLNTYLMSHRNNLSYIHTYNVFATVCFLHK